MIGNSRENIKLYTEENLHRYTTWLAGELCQQTHTNTNTEHCSSHDDFISLLVNGKRARELSSREEARRRKRATASSSLCVPVQLL